MNENGGNVTVTLKAGICDSKNMKETCGYGTFSDWEDKKNITGACDKNDDIIMKYPGEKCEKNDDCFHTPEVAGNCTNLVCVGKAECDSHTDCATGTFCLSKKCEKQRGSGKDCDDYFGCTNDLLCYKKKCSAYGSVKTGDELTSADVGGKLENMALLCEYGMVWAGKCIQTKYTGETVKKVDANGFVPCNWGEKCEYGFGTENKTEIFDNCSCGYNDKGQGYCKLDHTHEPASWKKSVSLNGAHYDNKCHTTVRFNCPLEQTKFDKYLESHKSETAHLYYNAVKCAQEVMSASYIQYSIAVVMIALAFIF